MLSDCPASYHLWAMVVYIFNVPAMNKGALQLQKMCGFLFISLFVLLFFFQLYFVLVLDLAGIAAM